MCTPSFFFFSPSPFALSLSSCSQVYLRLHSLLHQKDHHSFVVLSKSDTGSHTLPLPSVPPRQHTIYTAHLEIHRPIYLCSLLQINIAASSADLLFFVQNLEKALDLPNSGRPCFASQRHRSSPHIRSTRHFSPRQHPQDNLSGPLFDCSRPRCAKEVDPSCPRRATAINIHRNLGAILEPPTAEDRFSDLLPGYVLDFDCIPP